MIDFLKYRYYYMVFSGLMIVAFFSLFAYKRAVEGQAFSYSVDFTGGTQVLLEFSKPTSGATLVEILEKNGFPGSITREFGPKEVVVRVKEFSTNITDLGERITQIIKKNMPDVSVKLLQIDSIGQGVGEALTWNSIKAVVIGLILMLLYIAWRFWSAGYAVGAVVALFHDAIAILLFFLLFNKEISVNVIGAILAVLGYSINDTIVIFTQIRDNLKANKQASIYDVVNMSLNQTLRRTILTSISTALIVLSLIIFGGEVLRDLSTALLIGIIFGTYSSIYIASPVMLLFKKKES